MESGACMKAALMNLNAEPPADLSQACSDLPLFTTRRKIKKRYICVSKQIRILYILLEAPVNEVGGEGGKVLLIMLD